MLTLLLLAAPAQAAKRPDLAPSKPAGVPTSANPVDGFATKVVTRNLGRARSGRTTIAFFLSKDGRRSAKDLPFATELRVAKLAAGKRAARRGRIVIPPDATSGRWQVLACVDPDKDMRESKEGNNCAASQTVQIRGADPLKVGFTRETGAAAGQLMVQSEVVSATGADGTVYALDLGDASGDLVGVRMTPVSGLTPAPGNVTPRGGVLIEPAGRLLSDKATLVIVPPELPPAARLLGFGFAGDGSEFHLEPARIQEGAVFMDVYELGAYGYGVAPATASVAADSAADLHLPAATRSQFQQKATEAARAHEDVGRIACDYFNGNILPRLRLAVRTGNKQQIRPLFQDTIQIQRTAELVGAGNLDCMDEVQDLFQKILTRLFDEAYKRCTAGGGDPVAEAPEMISLLRERLLLGAPDAVYQQEVAKVVDCFDFEYEGSYSSQYGTLTTGGWSSSGSVAAGGLRFGAIGDQVRQSLPQSMPSAQFSSDCSGSYTGHEPSQWRVSGELIAEERFVGRFVAGRYKPDADIVTEFKLRVRFSSEVIEVFTIDCGGGPSPWNLAASQEPRDALLPTKGGTASVTTGTLEPASDCVECQKVTGTISVQVAPG
jgi:hypothetical protein